MKCPKCGIEMMIQGTRTEVNGDDSPTTPTEVYTVLVMTCRNPQCQGHTEEVKEKIYTGVKSL